MLRRFSTFALLAFFVLCLSGWTPVGTGLPKSPDWQFGHEVPLLGKGYLKWHPPDGGVNELTENQKVINSWGYKARPVEEIKDLLPKFFYDRMNTPESYGDFRLNETEYLPMRGPAWELFQAATEKYKGTCYLDEQGWLYNYKAGLPFPDLDVENDPQGVLKLIWNFYKRIQFDDRIGPFVGNIRDRRGNTRLVMSDNINFKFMGRLVLDPKPMYEPNPKQIDFVYSLPYMEPYGMRGTIALVHRYLIQKNDDMWMYLPSMRRVRRLATTQTQDRLPGGIDATWDTIDGFMGRVVDFDFEYLGRKELLMPVVSGTYPQLDPDGMAGVDNYFQRRNCYVVRAKYKRPITMTEMTIWLDPETYYSCYMLSKDLKGNDWMTQVYFWGRTKDWWFSQSIMSMADIQRTHASRVFISCYEVNNNFTPHDFSMERLIQKYGVR